jgi:hypothetical protein
VGLAAGAVGRCAVEDAVTGKGLAAAVGEGAVKEAGATDAGAGLGVVLLPNATATSPIPDLAVAVPSWNNVKPSTEVAMSGVTAGAGTSRSGITGNGSIDTPG